MYKIVNGVHVELTPDETAAMEAERANMPAPEPTPEERIDALESTTDDIILIMAELIGGN